jgi:acetoin utilization deacetylase AcuC-like enzyme
MGLAMPVVWSERHRGHAPAGGYWLGVRIPGDEEPPRGDVLHDGLVRAGATIVAPAPAPDHVVLAVHDAAFVDCLARAHPEWVAAGHHLEPGQPLVVPYIFALPAVAARRRPGRRPATIRAEIGLYAMDTMTLIGPGTFDAARAAVDAAVTAADLVLGGTRAAFAAGRPPGHHAGPDFFGGSCYLNSAAVAAEHLRRAGAARVAVVDIDAHHGNGTQEIFWDRADVLYTSVHVDPAAGWFPHFVGHADETGGPGADGANHNVCLAPGTGDAGWLAGLGRAVSAVQGHRPDALVVSLGVDAAEADPESPLEVTPAGFRAAGHALGELGLPTVFVLEGGYHLPTLAELVLATLGGFEEVS